MIARLVAAMIGYLHVDWQRLRCPRILFESPSIFFPLFVCRPLGNVVVQH